MVLESLGATTIVETVALGAVAVLGSGQVAGWLAVVTSGEIAFQVFAPSFVCHTRQVPKYNVCVFLWSITRGGMNAPRSVPSIPAVARNPFPIIPSPAKATAMIKILGGTYSHSP
jgi:hypothetical protein